MGKTITQWPLLSGLVAADEVPVWDVSGAKTHKVTAADIATAGLGGLLWANWTPALQIGGATTGITYTTQTGRYFQLAKFVVAMGYINLSSKGSLSGAVTITLPVTGSLTVTAPGQIFFLTMGVAVVEIMTLTSSTNAAIYIATAATTSMTAMTEAHLADTSKFRFQFIYEAA